LLVLLATHITDEATKEHRDYSRFQTQTKSKTTDSNDQN